MKPLSHKRAGFALSLETLFAVAAFSMISAQIMNLLYRGSQHAVESLQQLKKEQQLAKVLYGALLTPSRNATDIPAAGHQHIKLMPENILEKSVFKEAQKYMRRFVVKWAEPDVDKKATAASAATPPTGGASIDGLTVFLSEHPKSAEE